MVTEQRTVRDLKEGKYVMMEGSPCIINSISTSKPGKHGSAKARVEGKGVFDEQKRSFVQPVDAKVTVPIIERKSGQVVSVVDSEEFQLMDLDSYKTFTLRSDGHGFKPNQEIEYLEFEENRKLLS